MLEYFGRKDSTLQRITCLARLSDVITQATQRELALRQFNEISKPTAETDTAPSNARQLKWNTVQQICGGRPPDEVRQVVRALFVRDLVDMRQSGCGYTDFLIWTRFDVTPLDPCTFW